MTEKQLYLSDCIYFDVWQDTDDYGREIAPPVLDCGKRHNNCKECKDYRSCYDDKKKQFILHEHHDYGFAIEDTTTGDWLSSSHQYIDKMNELSDENTELHIQIDFLKCESQHLQEVLKENRELKQEVDFYKYFSKDARKLELENEELKQQIEDLRTDVLNSIHKANGIECDCCPCVVEKCVKKVVE